MKPNFHAAERILPLATAFFVFIDDRRTLRDLYSAAFSNVDNLIMASVAIFGVAPLVVIYFMSTSRSITIYIGLALSILAFGILAKIIILYAIIYKTAGLIDADHHVVHDPSVCLYFSLTTWTTVGYGDFVPTESARFVAASEATLGYFALVVVISIIARIFAVPHTSRP